MKNSCFNAAFIVATVSWVTTKRYIAIAGIVLAAIGLTILFRDNKNYFDGKHLSHWAEIRYDSLHDDQEGEGARAAEAIRTIGTNGLPVLLGMMTNQPPRWRVAVYKLFNRTVGQLNRDWQLVLYPKGPSEAAEAFRVLGRDAAPAIPELTRLMREPNENTSRLAGFALGGIGVPAIPSIAAGLTNRQWQVRRSALWGCRVLETNAAPLLPIVIDLLEKPRLEIDPPERARITTALAELDFAPEQVIPVLQNRLNDSDSRVRRAAVNGIARFATRSDLALPALQQASASLHPDVSGKAKRAIKAITEGVPFSE